MADGSHFVREQSTENVPQYCKRVTKLAAIYVGIVVTGVTADALILWHGKFFVTLSQRSNVETLTLAVALILFGYLTILSLPGAWGALKILYLNLPLWLGQDREVVETRKQRALKKKNGQPATVYLNCLVYKHEADSNPFEIPLEDNAGSLGRIVVDGVKMSHLDGWQHRSNSLLAFFEQRICHLVQQRDSEAVVQIVQWATIDDEAALQYNSMVCFSRNLAEHLQTGPLWPAVELTEADITTLQREASELCPALRNEAHLPDVEYEVEHRLPIIPEPLAFIALSRQERRADPLSSMGCALLTTLLILAFLLFFVFRPPWVPSK